MTTGSASGPRALERFTSGQSIGVDVAGIERDLAALWRKASSEDTSVTRACAWNLVVTTHSEEEALRARKLADALSEAVPSRTLVLNQRPAGEGPEVEAYVTANCRQVPGGGKTVCTEEITIEARGSGGDHLPSLLRALLVPDIPTAVLWAGMPPHAAMVQELLAGADRVIIDSSSAHDRRSLERVEHLGASASGPQVADLSWLRLGQLRHVLAGAFDPPADPTLLRRLSRVVVRCNQKSQAAALLLLGWLGEQLDWGKPTRGVGRATPGWMLPRAGGAVLAELEFCDEAMACGLAAVTLESDRGEVVRVVWEAGQLVVHAGGACHPVPGFEHTDEQLVVAAFGTRGGDRLYRPSLARAARLERA